MIEYRQAMVAKRVRTKNALRALLRGQGIAAPRGLWTGKGLAWLKTIAMDGQLRTVRRDMLLEELELFSRQIPAVTRQLPSGPLGREDAGAGRRPPPEDRREIRGRRSRSGDRR